MEFTRADIMRALSEAHGRRGGAIVEKIDALSISSAVAPGLKVVHDSGLKYDVVKVGRDMVTLRAPDGAQFVVRRHDFEREYSVD